MGLFLWSCRTQMHKNTLCECASLVPAQLEPLGKLRPRDSLACSGSGYQATPSLAGARPAPAAVRKRWGPQGSRGAQAVLLSPKTGALACHPHPHFLGLRQCGRCQVGEPACKEG